MPSGGSYSATAGGWSSRHTMPNSSGAEF